MGFFELFPSVSLLTFTSLVVINAAILRIKGVRINSRTEKQNRSRYFMYPLFLVIFHLWIFEVTQPLLHISLLPTVLTAFITESEYLQIAGVILLSLSALLLFITLVHFGKSFRFGINTENTGKLVTNGIFSVSRNPFFLSIILHFAGMALMFPGPFMLTMALAAFTGIHFFILKEERYMKDIYGREYDEYSKRVRRYL